MATARRATDELRLAYPRDYLAAMNLTGLLSITGKPGLYRMGGSRKGGLLVEPLGGGRREFVTQRNHQFTPLESIAIYTDDGESVPLAEVLERMREQADDNPVPDAKEASATQLREYLLDVLPTHDQSRVYTSDIKKLVKWYALLDEAGVLDAEPEAPSEGATDDAEEPESGAATADDEEDAAAQA